MPVRNILTELQQTKTRTIDEPSKSKTVIGREGKCQFRKGTKELWKNDKIDQ